MSKELIISRELDASSLERACKLSGLKPPAHIHLAGVCGTGMAAVLTLLKSLGFYVTGSDKAFYPPMGELVRREADLVYEGYSADNLKNRPDLVVIGNNLSRNNPEVEFVIANEIPFASMPEVFSGLLIGSREQCPCSIVVSGTHGKTTTSAAVATLFEVAGRKPGYFIGGIPLNLPTAIRAVDHSIPLEKRIVVLEGDEYDSAFFAKYSKFHSYRPDIALVTSLEFDHADIFNDIKEIESEFSKFVSRVPSDGVVLVADSGPNLQSLVLKWNADLKSKVMTYGEREGLDYRLLERAPEEGGGQILTLRLAKSEIRVKTSMSGPQNAWNLLAVAAIGELRGLEPSEIVSGLEVFRGVLRRQQILIDQSGVKVIEDFAHHPTAVNLTLQGLRETYPNSRIIAAFEPRSNTSRRSFFQDDFAKSFGSADLVYIQKVDVDGAYSNTSVPVTSLNVENLVTSLGTKARSFLNGEQLLVELKSQLRKGDVVVLMSNGDFGGLPKLLPELIKELKV